MDGFGEHPAVSGVCPSCDGPADDDECSYCLHCDEDCAEAENLVEHCDDCCTCNPGNAIDPAALLALADQMEAAGAETLGDLSSD